MNGTFYDLFMAPLEMATLSQLRSELLSHATGKVLEIGMGTGRNLPYYPESADVVGIEPDESMRKEAMKLTKKLGAKVSDGDAMSLQFRDAEFDTVVGTLVFCTIPDPKKALAEVYRVLKPGGKFLLLEHVRKDSPITGPLLDTLTPLWKHLSDGCHLNRDPSLDLTKLGFEILEFKSIWRGLGKVWVLRKAP